MPACMAARHWRCAVYRIASLARRECNAATGNDTFLDRCTGSIERVIDAVLFLFYFHFRRATDLDHGNAARRKLGEPFLQFLAIVVGS